MPVLDATLSLSCLRIPINQHHTKSHIHEIAMVKLIEYLNM